MPSGVYDHYKIRNQLFCSIEDCNEKHYGKGLCHKHYLKQWREDHKEYCAEYGKQYQKTYKKKSEVNKRNYLKYKKRILKQGEQYRQKHREYFTIKSKQYYQEHKEYYVEQNKQYRQNNKEYYAEYAKQWSQTSAGKASLSATRHNRRTLLRDLTKETVQKVYDDNIKKYGVLTCYLCFKPILDNEDSLDHSTPLTRQGTNKYENLGIAHLTCNKKKQTMTLEEWYEK